MIQGQTVGHASPTIMADQREGRKSKVGHHLDQFLCHRALRIGKMVLRGSRYSASAVCAQVHADYRVILSKLGGEESPLQARAGKPMHQQNSGSLSIAAIKYPVSGDLDFTGLECCPVARISHS